MSTLKSAVLIASATALVGSTAASAASDNDLAEIVVTAQRRAEKVQDVPVSVSIVTADQLERQQVSDLSDLSKTTAALSFGQIGSSNGGGGGGFIRGIGTASLSRSAEGAVGVVVDGVVQGNTATNNLFDIARVEVLKGPQGTLFGQSVSAGVVNVTTQAPDPSHVYGELTTELSANDFLGSEYGRTLARTALNVPLSADSAVRVSAFSNHTTDVGRNTYTNTGETFDQYGLRARYLGHVGGATVNLIGEYSNTNDNNAGWYTIIKATTTPMNGVSGPTSASYADAFAACGVKVGIGNFDNCSSTPGVQKDTNWGLSAQIDAPLGEALDFTSITAYRVNNQYVSLSITEVPAALTPLDISFAGPTDYTLFTQEFRLASDASKPVSYTVGAFYYDAITNASSGSPGAVNVSFSNPPPTSPNLVIVSTDAGHYETQNLSAFGEVRAVTGSITTFAGLRYITAKLTAQDATYTDVNGGQAGPTLTENNLYKNNDIAWRVGAEDKLSDTEMLYLTVAHGYKNAQLQPVVTPNGGAPISNLVVYPEKPTSVELGLKSTLVPGRLYFNIDGYYQVTKNLQTQTLLKQAGTLIPLQLPANVSQVESRGIEADLFGNLGSHVSMNLSTAYNVATYPSDYFAADGISLQGQQLAYAPRFSAVLSSEYKTALGNDMEGFASLNLSYRTEERLSDNQSTTTWTVDPSRTVAGLRVGVRVKDRWMVSLFGENLGATRIPSALLPALPEGVGAYYTAQAKRLVGLQASLKF